MKIRRSTLSPATPSTNELQGGAGNDVLFGGSGSDTASYQPDSAGVIVDLAIAGAQDTVGSGKDALVGIENLIGSNYGDWLIGNDDANWLFGGDGGDQLFGRGGNDWIYGGENNDVLHEGLGNDIISGGSGIEMASYIFASEGVIVSLDAKGVQNTYGDGQDWLVGIENLGGSLYAVMAQTGRSIIPA